MRRPVTIAVAAALLATFASGAGAAAFELAECTLTLQSFDADGEPLDTAVGDDAGGEGGTREDPFLVDYQGTVRYEGSSGEQVITDHSWSVDLFLIPTPLRGSDPNEAQESTRVGEIDVSATLPVRVSGLFFLSGRIEGEGGSCRGRLWLRVLGEPAETATTIPFWIALAIVAVGLIVLWAARPSVLAPTAYVEVRE
jgi:hypothetical protein